MQEASDALSKLQFAKCIAGLLHYYTCKLINYILFPDLMQPPMIFVTPSFSAALFFDSAMEHKMLYLSRISKKAWGDASPLHAFRSRDLVN